jgi:hypothetical protein
MQTNDGALLFKISADQSDINEKIEAIKKQFESLTKKTQEEGEKQAQVWQNLIKGATAYFTFQGATAFMKQVIAVRSQFQQLEIAFGTMLKSKEKANELMAQMTDLAAKTPFGLQEVSEGAKRLLAFQVPAEEVTETLRRMGDVAAGLGVPMGQLIHVYGQVKAQGKLMTNDLYQFMNAGIPIIAELSKVVGKSETEIKDMVSAGKIGFAEVQAVIKGMTDEGGLFYNLMAEQSKTLSGQLSNLEDNFDNMLNEIGKATEGIASGAISSVAFLVENYQTLGKVIAGLIATYGAYRTAVLVNIALTKGWAVAAKEDAIAKGIQTIATNAATVATKALNTAMKANPYVLVATAVVGLVSAVVLFNKEMTVAEKAQKAYNEEQERQKGVLQKEREEYEQLIDVVKDENQSKGKRIEAFQRLQSLYPDIFSKYKTEEELIKNIAKALKELNGVQKDRDLKMDQDYMQRLEMQKKALQSSLRTSANPAEIANIKEQIQSVDIQIEKARKQYNWQSTLNKIDTLAELSAEDKVKERKLMIEEYNRRHNAKQAKNKNLLQEGEKKDIRKTILPAVVATGYENFTDADLGLLMSKSQGLIDLDKERNKVIDTRNELLAQQKELATKINAIQSQSGQTQADKDELKKLQEEKKNIDKQLQEEYNEGKAKTTKAAKSEHPIFDQEAHLLQTTRLAIDNELAQQKANIEQMQEGYEKELALVRYYYDEKAEAIRRGGEDARRALEKERADSKGSMSSDTYNARLKAINENEIIANKQNSHLKQQQEESLIKSMLEKYKGYDEKRRDIEHKFQEDKKILLSEIAKIEAENVDGIYNERIKQLKKALKELEKLKNDELFKLETDSQEAGTTISNLFGNLSNMNLSDLDSLIADAEVLYQKMKDLGNVSPETLHAISQGLENAKGKAREIRPVFSALAQDFKEFMKAIKEGKDTDKAAAFEKLKGSVLKAAGTVKTLYNFVSELNVVDLGDFSAKIAEIQNVIGGSVDKAMQMGEVFKSLGKSAKTGMIIGAVAGLLSSGFEIASKARMEHEKKLQEIATSKLNQQSEYNRLLWEERMLHKENTSVFGTKEIANALDYLKIYQEQWKEFKKNTKSGLTKERREYLKNNSIPLFSSNWHKNILELEAKQSNLEKIRIADGSYTTGALWWKKSHTVWKGITDVYPNLIKANSELDVELAKSIVKYKEFGDNGKQALQNIIDQYDRAQEAQKKFEEYVKNTFGELGNSITDSVYKALQNGENAFESFSKTIGSIIGRLGKQLMFERFVAEPFKELQDKILKVGKETDNSEDFAKRSSELVSNFGNTMKSKVSEMETFTRQWNEMAKANGFGFLDEQRRAAEKGFTHMSQDTGVELNGRFTLMTALEKQTVDSIKEMHQSLVSLSERQLRHLANIDTNTYQLHQVKDDISGMKKDMAGMKRGIDDLTTKGIKIRS